MSDRPPPVAPSASTVRPRILVVALFVMANILAAGLGQGLRLIPGVSVIFWPPAGIFVAALLSTSPRTWPVWILAAGAAEMTSNLLWFKNPVHVALLYFAANTAEALTATMLVNRFAPSDGPRARLGSPRTTALFVLLAGVLAPMIGATMIATIDAALDKHAFSTTWILVWLGDGTGLLLSAPLTLAMLETWRARDRIALRPALELAASCGIVVAFAWSALRGWLPTVYMTLPPLVWVAVRFRIRGAWIALTAALLTVAVFTRRGVGEFAGTPHEMQEQMVALQVFLAVAASTSLIVAGLAAQYDALLRHLQRTNESLERRIAERTKSLQESEERLRVYLDHAPASIAILDRELCYLYANARWRADFSLGDASIVGRSHYEVFPEVPERWRAIHQRALRGEVLTANEDRFERRDGTVQWLRWEVRPWRRALGEVEGIVIYVEDLTPRREAEERLRQTTNRLVAIQAKAPIGIVETAMDGRYLTVNEEMCRITGYAREELLGRTLDEITHPEDRASERACMERLLRGELESYRIDKRLLRRDGSTVWADVHRTVLRANDGAVVCAIGVILDVTEQRDAELALRASEAFGRSLMNGSADCVKVLDRDGRLLHMNAPGLGLMEIDDFAPLRSRAWADLWPDDAKPDIERSVHAARTGAAYTFQAFCPTARGTPKWWDVTVTPVRDDAGGPVVRLLAVSRDMTARKWTAERQRLLSETAAILLVSNDPDTMLRRVFDAIAENLALDVYFNFMVDDTGAALRLASYGGISAEQARAFDRLELGQAVCGRVAQNRRPERACRIHESSDPAVQPVKALGVRLYVCTPLIAGDRLLGTLSFGSRGRDDIADDDLEFLRTICHYVAAAYERLRLVEELRDADRRKDAFLATLAHELRNPLAPIRSSLELISSDVGSPTLRRATAMMDRQLTQLVRLVDDLLDVSRITSGKLELRWERVSMQAVIEAAIETARPAIERAGHRLEIAIPEEPLMVRGDSTRLAQVVSNLLLNAAKYTHPEGTIGVAVAQDAGTVRVTVRDTGIGIPALMLDKVFDMFTQVDRTLEKSTGGLGIGLSLVRGLVALHGGTVVARSDGEGLGSEFVVRLPVSVAADTPAPNEMAKTELRTGARRILVVDDNPDAADSLADLLVMMGHEVVVAYDGEAGVTAARSFRPHIVLCDLGMPKMNGYDAARTLRRQDWGAGMVLVALTGWGAEEDRRKTVEAGFDHHLVKPVDLATLRALLAKLEPRAT